MVRRRTDIRAAIYNSVSEHLTGLRQFRDSTHERLRTLKSELDTAIRLNSPECDELRVEVAKVTVLLASVEEDISLGARSIDDRMARAYDLVTAEHGLEKCGRFAQCIVSAAQTDPAAEKTKLVDSQEALRNVFSLAGKLRAELLMLASSQLIDLRKFLILRHLLVDSENSSEDATTQVSWTTRRMRFLGFEEASRTPDALSDSAPDQTDRPTKELSGSPWAVAPSIPDLLAALQYAAAVEPVHLDPVNDAATRSRKNSRKMSYLRHLIASLSEADIEISPQLERAVAIAATVILELETDVTRQEVRRALERVRKPKT